LNGTRSDSGPIRKHDDCRTPVVEILIEQEFAAVLPNEAPRECKPQTRPLFLVRHTRFEKATP
jgi:hypothetical protein